VPAGFTYYWTGLIDGDFDKAGNWAPIMVGEGDPPGPIPGAEDHVVFAPYPDPLNPFEPPEARPCGNMHPPGAAAYASVTLMASYDSVVTVATGFSTRGFFLYGGTIDQPSSGTDITVIGGPANDDFIWTGGTLNSTSHLATLTVTGSSTTGRIAPAGGGTVNLGSNLTLTNSAAVTTKEGTINLTTEGGLLNITSNAVMNVAPENTNLFTLLIAGGESQINVTTGGSLTFESGDTTSHFPLYNNDGTVTIFPTAFAWFLNGVQGDAGGRSYVQSSGTTRIYGKGVSGANARLNAQNGMLMSGGTLDIETQMSGVPLGEAAIVIPDGKSMTISGGQVIWRGGDAAYHNFGVLRINGDVNWTGGVYRPHVSAENQEWADLWWVQGTFTVGGTAVVNAKAVDAEANYVDPPAEMFWLCLIGGNGITSDPALVPGWDWVGEQTGTKLYLHAAW
jgi:hypothetical protein